MWLDLVNSLEAKDAKQLSISAVHNTIASTYFTHESMTSTFTDYCNKHMAANNELILRSIPMDGLSQVRAFIQGIKVPDFMAVK